MEMVFQNLRTVIAAGIRTTVNMVIGVPGETEGDVDDAIRNIASCKNYISVVESFNTLLLVCGSEYYRNPENTKFDSEKQKRNLCHPCTLYSALSYGTVRSLILTRRSGCAAWKGSLPSLYKNGVDIGSFASKIVENLRLERSKTAEVSVSEICIGKPESAA